MTNQNNPVQKKSVAKSGTAIKVLIMASSLVATVGGWATLAAGQMINTVNTAQPQALVQSANSNVNTSSTTVRQATVSNTQTRAVARTRSSR
jgi:hypothetical protein